jgi:hypothetical protein
MEGELNKFRLHIKMQLECDTFGYRFWCTVPADAQPKNASESNKFYLLRVSFKSYDKVV